MPFHRIQILVIYPKKLFEPSWNVAGEGCFVTKTEEPGEMFSPLSGYEVNDGIYAVNSSKISSMARSDSASNSISPGREMARPSRASRSL